LESLKREPNTDESADVSQFSWKLFQFRQNRIAEVVRMTFHS
jgi:hypothetical protein